MKKKLLIAVSFFFLLNSFVYAQDDCSVILRKAQDTYDAGNLEQIPGMLSSCLESGFNKVEKIQAYRLLALTYLFDDKTEKAQESIAEMLKIDPEYEINEAIDPVEFKELHQSYKTDPLYSVGILGGINFSQISLMETYGVDNFSNSGTYQSNGIGYQFGLFGSYILMENLYVNLGAIFKGTKFQFSNTYEFNRLENSGDQLGSFGNLIAQESHTWLSIPVSFTYDYPIYKKISAFGRLGFTSAFLLGANSTFSRTYDEKYSAPEVTGVPVDMKQNRNNINFWLTTGVGAKYNINKGNLFFEVQYNRALKNMVNESTRYANPTLTYQYFYVDDNFQMNDLAFSIGYTRHFYNPALKKEKSKKKSKSEIKVNTESIDTDKDHKSKKTKKTDTY